MSEFNEEAKQTEQEQIAAEYAKFSPLVIGDIQKFLSVPGILDQLAKNVLLVATKALDEKIGEASAQRNAPYISGVYYDDAHHVKFARNAEGELEVIISECHKAEDGSIVVDGPVATDTDIRKESADLLRQVIASSIPNPAEGEVYYVTTVGRVTDATKALTKNPSVLTGN